MASGYTKHYYIEGQRIASKIGAGLSPSITPFQNNDNTTPIHGNYDSLPEALLNMCYRADECVDFDTKNTLYGRKFSCIHDLSEQDNLEKDLYFYHSDHIGSSSFITDRTGIASQHLQYLPFGELFVEQRSTANYYTPYKFSGKEKDEETSYSYFGARYYMSDVSVWLSVDPMKEKYPYQSPYTYCGWNPVRIVDPDGRSEGDGIFVDGTGKPIGDDGRSDGKVYVIKTTESLFPNGVAGAGLSQEEQDKTTDFIQSNSGNTAAFQSDDIAYRNSIEIDGNADNRQEMVDEICRDNGQGGRSLKNNREYGGYNENGVIKTVPPGKYTDPRTTNEATVDIPTGYSTFHDHPSGFAFRFRDDNMCSFEQCPSQKDIDLSGSFTNYEFSRSKNNQKVYIYNSKGVQATIPTKYFVNFKK